MELRASSHTTVGKIGASVTRRIPRRREIHCQVLLTGAEPQQWGSASRRTPMKDRRTGRFAQCGVGIAGSSEKRPLVNWITFDALRGGLSGSLQSGGMVNEAEVSLQARTSENRAYTAAYGQNPKPIEGRMPRIGHVNGTGADMVSRSEAFSRGWIPLVSRPKRTRTQAIPEDARYWRAGEGYRQTHGSWEP